jgi:hypothetical protein
MKFIAALFMAGILMISCERGPVTTNANSDSDLAARDRSAYEDQVDARLKEFDHRFDGLDARLKGMDRAYQDHLRTDIDELRARRDVLKQKLGDLHKVSDQSWRDVRASLDHDLDRLEVAYNNVSANNHGRDHAPLRWDDDDRGDRDRIRR